MTQATRLTQGAKQKSPRERAGEDCEFCRKFREKGTNFCGMCGKQLKEHPVIIDYRSLAQ